MFNEQWTVTMASSAIRLVSCEECDTDYIYKLERETEGHGNAVMGLGSEGAKKRAAKEAKKKLDQQLTTACDAVPCPECGHYQDHMLGQARSDKSTPLLAGAAGGLVVGIILLLAVKSIPLLGAVVLMLTFGAGGIGLFFLTTYDPNKQPEQKRLEIAEEKAYRRKDFERESQAKSEKSYEKFLDKLERGTAKSTSFEFPLWVDRGQIRDEADVKVRLPNGEKTSIQLDDQATDGDTFRFDEEVEGRTIRLVAALKVYTRTKKK
ncbi:MAG: hypothetical protein ACRCZF_00185 [Gemmataceae bacterium]